MVTSNTYHLCDGAKKSYAIYMYNAPRTVVIYITYILLKKCLRGNLNCDIY